MLDIKFIREHADLVLAGAKKKSVEVDIKQLLSLDTRRREKIQEVEGLRAEQNRVSDEVAKAESDVRAQRIEEMRELKSKLESLEFELKTIETEFDELM